MRVENFTDIMGHYEYNISGHHFEVDTLAAKQDHTGKIMMYVILKEDNEPAVLKWVEHRFLKSCVKK
ncbi:MAG: hypothetical protein HRT61_15040 [Ekhidna sp.]|nr:hypothetical protein [Ekhidna sp.]